MGDGKEDRSRVSRTVSHGYTCSMCQSVDSFNEEELYYNPPIGVFRRALRRLFSDEQCGEESPNKRQVALNHPLHCTRKLRHRDDMCSLECAENCTVNSHWKLCPGFYSVTLVVRFTMVEVRRGNAHINYFRDIELVDIAPMSKEEESVLGRGYRTLPVRRPRSPPRTCSQIADDIPHPLSLPDLEDMWLRLSDAIFQTDISMWKLSHFSFLTDACNRLKITESGVITPRPTTLVRESRRSALAFKHQGVPLSCSLANGKLPDIPHITLCSERLTIPCRQILDQLSAESDIHLYFNSFHVCKGEFGTDECHVTLALVCGVAEEEDMFCRNRMLSIQLKQNPILQIDQEAGIVKVVESLEISVRRFWIDLYVFGALNLENYDTKWKSLTNI